MDDPFDLSVIYKGEESFYGPAAVIGLYHKFEVEVNGQTVLFEPDEERNYRAVVDPEKLESSKIDVELLKAFDKAIEAVVK